MNIRFPGIDCLRWKLNLADIILLAAALGIDCMIVSFSQGLIFQCNRLKISLMLAGVMGLFQGLMPCLGYLGAGYIDAWVKPFSKLIVFSIFLILGLKFIIEAFRKDKDVLNCITLKCLIWLGLATSIDAFAAGVTLKFTGSMLLLPALIIGLVSFWMSVKGFWFGIFFKKLPSFYLEIAGGFVLIFLALKSLSMPFITESGNISELFTFLNIV